MNSVTRTGALPLAGSEPPRPGCSARLCTAAAAATVRHWAGRGGATRPRPGSAGRRLGAWILSLHWQLDVRVRISVPGSRCLCHSLPAVPGHGGSDGSSATAGLCVQKLKRHDSESSVLDKQDPEWRKHMDFRIGNVTHHIRTDFFLEKSRHPKIELL